MNRISLWLLRLQFSTTERIRLWKLLTGLLDAGVEMELALETAKELAGGSSSGVGTICDNLVAALREDRFADEIADYLPATEALLFRQYGSTDTVDLFRAASRIAEANSAVRQLILGALIKPTALLLVLIIIILVMGFQFYPVIAEMVPVDQWDRPSQIMYAISHWLADNTFLFGVYMATAVVAYRLIRDYWTGRGRPLLDRIPPWSLHRLQCGAIFLQVIAQNALVGNDITPVFLDEMAEGTSRYQRSRILAIAEHLRTQPLGQAALAAGHGFPDREVNLVLAAIGDRPGWARNLDRYIVHWMEGNERKVKTMTAALHYALLLLLSATIIQAANSFYGMIDMLQGPGVAF